MVRGSRRSTPESTGAPSVSKTMAPALLVSFKELVQSLSDKPGKDE